MRKSLLVVLVAAVALAVWFWPRRPVEPSAAEMGAAVAARRHVLSSPPPRPSPISVSFAPSSAEAPKEMAHLAPSTVQPFGGSGKLMAVSTDQPYLRDLALFLHAWDISLTDEQRRRIEEAYIRLHETRMEYEASIQTVDRSVTGVTTIKIPSYPQSGLALKAVFQNAVAQVLPGSQALAFDQAFDATLMLKNAELGERAQTVVITLNDDGSGDPYYRIDYAADSLLTHVKTNTFVLRSQLADSPFAQFIPFLPK